MNQAERADTKTKILDAAEKLFARRGFDATSLRDITAEAGVNLAAVNYHFGSKEDLVKAAFARRVEPLNRKRIELLEEIERAHPGGSLPLRPVLEAFFHPVVELLQHPEWEFQPLIGRIWADAGAMRQHFLELMYPVKLRFSKALTRALPHLSKRETAWRMMFTVSILAFTMANSRALKGLTNGLCRPEMAEDTVRRMVDYAAAGFSAPVSDKRGEHE